MANEFPPWEENPEDLTYDPETTATVFSFDRDKTVDVNPRRGKECVPLEWVQHLAHETPHVVYAHGNQTLVTEADIPGTLELVANHPTFEDHPTPESLLECPRTSRKQRIRMVGDLYPEASQYVVVDDLELADVDGWEYYTGWDFVDAARDGAIVPELPP